MADEECGLWFRFSVGDSVLFLKIHGTRFFVHGRSTDFYSELFKFPEDPWRSPQRIYFAHLPDQFNRFPLVEVRVG